MEPASQSKEPHQPWKTEPVWNGQELGRPISTSCQKPEEKEPRYFPETKPLVGREETVSISAKNMKAEPCSRYEEGCSSTDLEFQPKKKAIWQLLGTTSYPLVPKWASYQKHSKDAYSFPGSHNHSSNAFEGRKNDKEDCSEEAVPANEISTIKKEPVHKPVFSPMLNSLLTVKTPVPEPIQENTHLLLNHCTKEPSATLTENPDQTPTKPILQKTPPASTKPRGPYRAKINPSLKHSSDSCKLDVAKSSCTDTVSNNMSVNSSVHVSGESNLPSQSEKNIDQKPTPESKFLLIDDQGVPYTMMKREMENKPKEEGTAASEEKAPVPKKVHYCLVCYRTFLYLSDLERHSITHSEHKPFECKLCGKTFKRSSHLQRHKHIHTGERPFLCPICQKGFRESGELHRHQRTHTGEKPFQCDLCHLRFTERNTLRRHIKRKHTLDNLLQQDSDNLSDWGEAFAEAPEKDQQASNHQTSSDSAQKSSASSSPQSSPSLN